MKITRIVNGQEMEFELTDSELRAALVNTLFSPEKGGVLAEEAGELFSEALFNMDEEMACAVSPSEYTTTELVGTRITERLQDTLAEAAREYADRYKAIVEWAERHDEATIQANIKAVQRRMITRMMKLIAEHPDETEIIKRPEENDGCLYCKVPSTWLKIAPPVKREMSDEQKAAASQRMQKLNEQARLSKTSLS